MVFIFLCRYLISQKPSFASENEYIVHMASERPNICRKRYTHYLHGLGEAKYLLVLRTYVTQIFSLLLLKIGFAVPLG